MSRVYSFQIEHLRFTILIISLLIISVAVNADERIIWQGGLDRIALNKVEGGNVQNDHPVSFSEREIYQLLGSVQLRDADDSLIGFDFLNIFSDDEKSLPASHLFTRADLSKLSKAVASGLSQAKPDEDIVFRVSSRHEKKVGKATLTTTGRIFYSGGKLNLIAGEIRVDIVKKYRMRGGYSDVAEKVDYHKLKNFKLDMGSRNSQSDLDYEFLADNTHTLKPYRGKQRKDWLLIDVAALREQIAEHEEKTHQKDNIVQETVVLKQQTNDINKEQEALKRKVERMEKLLESRENTDDDSSSRNTGSAASAPISVEERLSLLKKLYDDGMITEDLYKNKMSDILKDL